MAATPVNLDLWSFEGRWQLTRVVENAVGPDMTLSGTATFSRHEDGLMLVEEGTLEVAGQPPMQGSQRYIWRPDGDQIATFFADGRDFFRFRPDGEIAAAHWCSPDQYDVVMDFTHWPEWRATWTVKGPRKDYVMRSRYRRA
jgi:hypothetical protein